MNGKLTQSRDIFFYLIGLVFTFLFIFFSRKLSAPLMNEIESGTSLTELVFQNGDQFSYVWNLLVPTFLLIIGIAILVVLLWQMGKSIVLKNDTTFNKFLMLLISVIVVFDLIIAFQHGLDLILLNIKFIGVLLLIIFIIGLIIQHYLLPKRK